MKFLRLSAVTNRSREPVPACFNRPFLTQFLTACVVVENIAAAVVTFTHTGVNSILSIYLFLSFFLDLSCSRSNPSSQTVYSDSSISAIRILDILYFPGIAKPIYFRPGHTNHLRRLDEITCRQVVVVRRHDRRRRNRHSRSFGQAANISDQSLRKEGNAPYHLFLAFFYVHLTTLITPCQIVKFSTFSKENESP